jgi:hypothetical protein
VVKLDLYSEFAHAARVLKISELPAHPQARPVAVEIAGAKPALLVVAPGRGRGASTRFHFELPGDTTPKCLAELSPMIGPSQAGEPVARPIEFAFTAPAAGQASIVWAGIAGAGAGVRVLLDGKEAFHRTWPALPDLKASEVGRRQPAPPPIVLPYQAGSHTITIEGLGPAWAQIDHLSVTDLGRTIRAHAIGDGELALLRVQADEGAVPATVDLRAAGLADGPCKLTVIDLETGTEREQAAAIEGGVFHGIALTVRDTALVITR